MDLGELRDIVARLGGVRAAARAIGIPKSTLSNYCRGTRAMAAEVADRLRALVEP